MARMKHILVSIMHGIAVRRRGIFKAIACIVALAFIAVPSWVVNNLIGYVPLVAAVCALFVSWLYIFILRRGLEWQEVARVYQCTRGDAVEFVLRLKNHTILVCLRIDLEFHQADLFGSDVRSQTVEITLAPRCDRDFRFAMNFDHIGLCQAGLKRIVLHDLIGLFSFTFENKNIQTIEVMPRLYELNELEIESEVPTTSTTASRTILNEGIDYAHVRDYVWGDPIKSIHWKLSARARPGNYFTRIYEIVTNPGLTTIIDVCCLAVDPQVKMQLFDAVLESAIAADAYARKRGLETTLCFTDEIGQCEKFTSYHMDEAMHKIMRMMSQDTTRYEGDAIELIRKETYSINGQSNIAICTSVLTNELIETLIISKNQRKNPILFYAVPTDLEPQEEKKIRASLRRLGMNEISSIMFSSVSEIAEGVQR